MTTTPPPPTDSLLQLVFQRKHEAIQQLASITHITPLPELPPVAPEKPLRLRLLRDVLDESYHQKTTTPAQRLLIFRAWLSLEHLSLAHSKYFAAIKSTSRRNTVEQQDLKSSPKLYIPRL